MKLQTTRVKTGAIIAAAMYAAQTLVFSQQQIDTTQSSSSTTSATTAQPTSANASSDSPGTSSSSSDTANTASTQPAPADSQGGGGDIGGISGVPGVAADSSRMNFQADLFTGRFAYSVPIAVAPARQGAEPKIVLGYNSAAGNGWCGVGWTLDMGYIQRETRRGVPVLLGSTVPASQGLSAASVNYPQHGYQQGEYLTMVGGTVKPGASPAVFKVAQVDGGGRIVQLAGLTGAPNGAYAYTTLPANPVSFSAVNGGPGDGSAQANIIWNVNDSNSWYPSLATAVPVAHPYQPGDLLQIQGGVGFPAEVSVVSVNAIGEPDQLQVVNCGCYSTLPPSLNSPHRGIGQWNSTQSFVWTGASERVRWYNRRLEGFCGLPVRWLQNERSPHHGRHGKARL